MAEGDASIVQQLAIPIDRIDDGEPRAVEPDVPFEEWQETLSNRSEPDQHDWSADLAKEVGLALAHLGLVFSIRDL
jgi:hypothetical protein